LGGIQSQISSIIGSNSSGSNNQNALLLAAALRSGTGNGIGNNNDNNNSITLGAGKIFDRQESSSFPNMSSMGNILDFQNLTNSMPNSISLLLQSLQYQRRQQEFLNSSFSDHFILNDVFPEGHYLRKENRKEERRYCNF